MEYFADLIHSQKYRLPGESFPECIERVANAASTDMVHKAKMLDILEDQRFLPGGRIQAALGSGRRLTAYSCFVMPTIPDSMEGILDVAKDAGLTQQMGGGVGYDFSTIRPEGADVVRTGSYASGPLSFMPIYDTVCASVASAGSRRGAQMGVLRIDHPDIFKFIAAKQREGHLTNFNISVGVTDEFMQALEADELFDLRFGDRVWHRVRAKELWDELMLATWDWADPGVLFIDTINRANNLNYCEYISATNPCSEQPLPPNGACLLGSFNLVEYCWGTIDKPYFAWKQFEEDIHHVVEFMDNVIDVALYPLETQKAEAFNKRRMGIGITGLANCVEYLGFEYGSHSAANMANEITRKLNEQCYRRSGELGERRGQFPAYVQAADGRGLRRNSHLTSIAPTGTISLTAGNVSSGIEPVFAYDIKRPIRTNNGDSTFNIQDFGYREFGVRGKRTSDCTIDEHFAMLQACIKNVDSSVSKTINVGPSTCFSEFKEVYKRAHEIGAKGVSTFRIGGKKQALLTDGEGESSSGACYINEDGTRSCE